jgi:hypothetical protein
VAQGEGNEFKPQYHQKKKQREKKKICSPSGSWGVFKSTSRSQLFFALFFGLLLSLLLYPYLVGCTKQNLFENIFLQGCSMSVPE